MKHNFSCTFAVAVIATSVAAGVIPANAKPPVIQLPPQPKAAFVCRTGGTTEFFTAHTFAPRALMKGTRIAYTVTVVPAGSTGPVKGETVLKNTVTKSVKINLAQGEGQGRGCTAHVVG